MLLQGLGKKIRQQLSSTVLLLVMINITHETSSTDFIMQSENRGRVRYSDYFRGSVVNYFIGLENEYTSY